MMKRVISMLLVMIMLFGIVGCVQAPSATNGSASGTSGTKPSGTVAKPTAPPPTTNPQPTQPPTTVGGSVDEGRKLIIYWDYKGDPATADFWVWPGGTTNGHGYLVEACDYGVVLSMDVPEGYTEMGFIPRYDCSDPGGASWGNATKDYEQDRFVTISGNETVIYLKSGDPKIYTSTDGGKTLTELIAEAKLNLATMEDFNTIQYTFNTKVKIDSLDQVKLTVAGKEVAVSSVSNLGKEAANGKIVLSEKLDLTKSYMLEINGFDAKVVIPSGIFDCDEFINNYTYDGDDLGAVIHGDQTTFKVWAPTASKVILNLYEVGDGGSTYDRVEMTLGEKGVWEATYNCGHGTYYTYSVTTAMGTQHACDPYAKSAGLNGDRSMVIDLDLTDPENWSADQVVTLEQYTDAIIWEVHVRDFSNKIESSQYKGKYLAFTERNLTNGAGVSVGVDYLLDLGVTHIHLLPVYDYASVNESKNDQFNWGYDPENYNVPEGSYSTDPTKGEVRVLEFKQMVQALHNVGLGVVMDVVYNHTYDANSHFNKIVPYYYYRFDAEGKNTSASGCGNDTASERKMFRKFMIDSVTYWAEEYNLDGFRFDLMGLHDLETMRQIEQAVHAINPNAIIYGEGWTMGSTIDGSAQANQSQIGKIEASEGAAGSVSVFNDAIRDGLKGSVFGDTDAGYINGNYASTADKVKHGIMGGNSNAIIGWTVPGAAVINYMSAHDNHTLWDKLALTNPNATVEERMAMNRLGAAIVMISQGTPFWQAGEEILRTKPNADGTFNHNSYNSSDEVNNIRWDTLSDDTNEYAMLQYYKGLIQMRKAYDIFTYAEDVTFTFGKLPGGGMTVLMQHKVTGEKALVVINPTASADSYTLEGEWKLVANGTQAGSEVISTDTGAVEVDARSILVYVQ